ncbi:MAG: hypothetical protein C4520_14185 [Candidatus Abyssobacteria bacterium SURF_5]|uniref:histidine kinase n=1 Tax=Abyssobacteria bacterium (strain SURF_5) TaxID=2093360 RepID=A0A3A4NSN9_ABYX5|nr:MAG: hypothetical protein C4520_14185 [Candidatus Abyssubacteria bacterium SURF_5]
MSVEHGTYVAEDHFHVVIFPDLCDFHEDQNCFSQSGLPVRKKRKMTMCSLGDGSPVYDQIPANVEHLASIGQMVSFVAHEMRNPLQNIQLGVDILRMKIEENCEKLETLEQIEYGVHMLHTMVKDLLDYAKPIALRPCPTTISALIAKSLLALSNKINGIPVHLDLEQADREILQDVEKTLQLLINLMLNAVEAMPRGGELKVRSRFTTLNGANAVALMISDTGCGISESDLERIQQPFVTTKQQGVGLGIPICKKIIAAYGGTFHITSSVGKGTTVVVTLPVQAVNPNQNGNVEANHPEGYPAPVN